MRAAQGAASSAQATDRSLPGRPESSFPPLGLLSPPNPLRWASAGAPITASANGAGGDADPVFASSVQPTAAMSPRFWGAPGAHPRPFLSHRFLSERKRCPGRAGPPPGASRQADGAPRSSRPTGWWIRGQAGDHRSPLHRRPKLRISLFRVNAKAHSLRWASAGAPQNIPRHETNFKNASSENNPANLVYGISTGRCKNSPLSPGGRMEYTEKKRGKRACRTFGWRPFWRYAAWAAIPGRRRS